MNEHISNERVMDILEKYYLDRVNLSTLSSAIDAVGLPDDITVMSQEDRQKLVEAYNLYRAAPYDWHYRVE